MNVNHGITDTGKLKTIEIDKYEPIPDKPGTLPRSWSGKQAGDIRPVERPPRICRNAP